MPHALLLLAAGLADGQTVAAAPGALLASVTPLGLRVLAAGVPDAVAHHPAARSATVLRLPDAVLIPGLVNAHTHLDLTHIGPRPYDPRGGFAPWLAMVMAARARTPDAVADSVRLGVSLSIRGGVVAVGDIAAGAATGLASVAAATLRESPLAGVSFAEFFGMGMRQAQAVAEARAFISVHPQESDAVRTGLSPHAPYSAGLTLYNALAETSLPICTHLAESPEEREFLASAGARGVFRDLLDRVGLWDDTVPRELPGGASGHPDRACSPVAHLASVLARRPMLLAHVNDAGDDDIALIARAGAAVVWCPRGHDYFHRRDAFGPHRWRDMLDAGVTVALGTDSIINLPPGSSDRLSPLDEARRLARDGADPTTLLRLITSGAAVALGLDPSGYAFNEPRSGAAEGALLAGLVAVRTGEVRADPAAAVIGSSSAPLLLCAHRWAMHETLARLLPTHPSYPPQGRVP